MADGPDATGYSATVAPMLFCLVFAHLQTLRRFAAAAGPTLPVNVFACTDTSQHLHELPYWGPAVSRYKQPAWRDDHAILERLEKVSSLTAVNLSQRQIALQLGVNHETVRRDQARLRELWRESLGRDAEDQRSDVLARLEEYRGSEISVHGNIERFHKPCLHGRQGRQVGPITLTCL